MKKIIIAAAAVSMSLFALGGTQAQADVNDQPNTMSFSEYHDYVLAGMTRHNVEAPESTPDTIGEIGCGCHGTVYKRWTTKKTHHRYLMVSYHGNEGNSSIVLYRHYSGAWRVWNRSCGTPSCFRMGSIISR